MSGTATIRVEEHGAIVSVTIARPERRNALDDATIDALREVLREAAQDPARAAIVLRGEGTASFCAGSDLKAAAAMDAQGRVAHTARGQALMDEIEDHPCLVVAAVEGYCLGGGFELALACDLRLAGESATFGLPEVSLGLIPGWGGTYRLSRVVGLGHAKAIVLGGARLSAEEARAAGLLVDVVPTGEAHARGLELAERVVAGGRPALSRAKQLVNLGQRADNRTGSQLELLTEAILAERDDYGRRP